MIALSLLALALAAGPAILFWRNLREFAFAPPADSGANRVSILIPARNESLNIREAVLDALANDGAEVIVLDDNSVDDTPRILAELVANEPRLRVIHGKPLPEGWCGKNFACVQLAEAATRKLLLFVDADVRLFSRAAARMAAEVEKRHAALISGVPRQLTSTISERLLVPLVHFVLLAFLPMRRMRLLPYPAYATGCGQLIMVEAAAYRSVGGHGAIRSSLHDGLLLPRKFRERGFHTDLFDATDLATCRMYRSNGAVWRGFGKNAHEGLGAPALILPATLILFAGQVLPFLLLARGRTVAEIALAALAAACAILPRLLAAHRFRMSAWDAFLQPLSITALLAVQWWGLGRHLLGRPATWKDRAYGNTPRAAVT